jgi:hypothetical protein
MKRALLVAIALILGACAAASDDDAPETLALADSTTTSPTNSAELNVMRFEIRGEPFSLSAGICNTFDDGTFRFALAEGPVETNGHATATIERFDTGSSHEMIVVMEGTRDDSSVVSWYARGSVDVHDLTVSVIGGSVEGSAIFDSVGGAGTPGEKALGDFSIRCI